MNTYVKILTIVIPIFIGLVIFEKWYGWRKKKESYSNMDMICSLNAGITYVLQSVFGIYITVVSYAWLVDHIALVHVGSSLPVYFLAFIAKDFAGYISHRFAHRSHYFWNGHLIHHSSEHFNLGVNFRQPFNTLVNLMPLFLLPAALLGVPAFVIAIVSPIQLYIQFWYHTEHIGKLGFLEKILVTPTHHAIHHAINPVYIDKNYGHFFIIWDRLFGTFQAPVPGEKPVYGLSRPVRTWNPIRINFFHYRQMLKDAWQTRHFIDKFKIWVMPPDWRPADVAAKYPVQKIEDLGQYEKYSTRKSYLFGGWCWFQFSLLLVMVFHQFSIIGQTGLLSIALFIAYAYTAVYAHSELMDDSRSALLWELAKMTLGLGIVIYQKDWFGLGSLVPGIQFILSAYFIFSFIASVWFAEFHFNTETRRRNTLVHSG